jgi:hypothetical protein
MQQLLTAIKWHRTGSSDRRVTVGSILFDSDHQIIVKSKSAST